MRVQSRSGDFLRPRFRVPWCAIKAPSNFHSAMSFHMFGICGLRLHVREAPHLSVLAAVRRWLGDKSAVMGPCGKCAPHLFNTIVVSVCLCVCVFLLSGRHVLFIRTSRYDITTRLCLVLSVVDGIMRRFLGLRLGPSTGTVWSKAKALRRPGRERVFELCQHCHAGQVK